MYEAGLLGLRGPVVFLKGLRMARAVTMPCRSRAWRWWRTTFEQVVDQVDQISHINRTTVVNIASNSAATGIANAIVIGICLVRIGTASHICQSNIPPAMRLDKLT